MAHARGLITRHGVFSTVTRHGVFSTIARHGVFSTPRVPIRLRPQVSMIVLFGVHMSSDGHRHRRNRPNGPALWFQAGDALTSPSCCHNILHYGRIVSMPSTFRSSTANCVPTRLASALIVATGKTPHNFAIEPGYQLCTCSPLHWYVWTSTIWLSPFRRVAGNQLSIDHIYCRFACRRSNGSPAVN